MFSFTPADSIASGALKRVRDERVFVYDKISRLCAPNGGKECVNESDLLIEVEHGVVIVA